MQPIPETARLIDELAEFYDADLLGDLRRQAEAVAELVPELVGMSLAALRDGVTFTLVANDRDVAVLDAIQYLAGGPCVDAVAAERLTEFHSDSPDNESDWQTFAKATAATAVASTLTLPILKGDVVVGSVNLYAAAPGAFRGLHKEIAEILHAWAPGAVTNADLSFQTRRTAEESLDRMRTKTLVEVAVGVVIAGGADDEAAARDLLDRAAQRAGVTTEELAKKLVESFEPKEE